jgi:hypothetical protein
MSSLSPAELIGIWVAAVLSFAIFTFLYKDNPVYKFTEHLFLGSSLGYGLGLYFWENIKPKVLDPLFFPATPGDRNLWVLIPMLLGIFVLLRIVPRLAWLSRYSFAVYIGGAMGTAVPVVIAGNIMPQIADTLAPVSGTLPQIFNILVILVGVVATLIYFFYSLEHRGAIGGISRVGVFFIMISMGASFGNTVMARISLLIGRFQFLLQEWIGKALGAGG